MMIQNKSFMILKTYLLRGFLLLLFTLAIPFSELTGQRKAWFVDGFHGGIYGHYPMWQAKFMVDNLIEHSGWKINLEIEPETWDTVSVKDTENFKRFQEYFATTGRLGRIEFVNPTYAQPYMYNISGESTIRHFSYGIAKTLEYFPDATFITYSSEEPCFTSSLPQILKGFGYKYGVLRNPNTCWGGYTSAFGKDLVNWIGPDGTSMPAVPRYAVEGLSQESTWQTESWTNSNEFIEACFEDGIKFPAGMTLQDAGWDGGPWGNEYQPTIYTTWTEYIEMVKDKVHHDDWKFSLEDVRPGLVWGSQVLQKIAREIRVTENRMIMAEKMASLDFLINGKNWPSTEIDEAWRNLMLAQHHDCWIVPYNETYGHTWAENVTLWTSAADEIADRKINRFFNLTETTDDQKHIRVFNTLGATRTDRVSISLPENLSLGEWAVFDMKGELLPAQITADEQGDRMIYFDAEVPGMGYSTFVMKPYGSESSDTEFKELPGGGIMIETGYYKAVFDPAKGGTITSLIDKRNNNKELVSDNGMLNNLRGHFYQKGKFLEGSESHAKVRIAEDGDLFVRLVIENEIAGNIYKQLVTFNKTNPRIDFELIIHWQDEPGIGAYDHSDYSNTDREKAFYNDYYKLHLQFPFEGLGKNLYKNAPFDVAKSQLDNTLFSSWDSLKHNVILNWVDVSDVDDNYGVALFTDHTTSYLNTDELALGLTVQYVGTGLWGRHYGIHGDTHIRYALLPHKGNWEKAGVENFSMAWNESLTGGFVPASNKPLSWSLLETENENLHLTSAIIDGSDLIVRFYSTCSQDMEHSIRWHADARKVEIIDLNGEPVSEAQVTENPDGHPVTRLSLPRFGFQTLRLTGISVPAQ